MKLKLVATGILANHNREILIGKRPKTACDFPEFWEFPGGKIALNETPEEALIRELKEELGISVMPLDLENFYFLSHSYARFHVIILCYICNSWTGEIKNHVHSELRWVSIQSLSDYVFLEANLPILRRLKDGAS